MRNLENKILDSIMKEFAKGGYKGATTRQIAVAANVNEVTLFRRFKSKDIFLGR